MIEDMVREYVELEDQKLDVDSKLRELKKKIISYVKKNNKGRTKIHPIVIGDYVVKVREYERASWDINKLKEYFGDDFKIYVNKVVSYKVDKKRIEKAGEMNNVRKYQTGTLIQSIRIEKEEK